MTTFTYSHDDAGLNNQPIGYWSSATGAAVVHHIRTTLAEFGVTQPQWWILNQTITGTDDGKDRADVVATLRGYLDIGDGALEHDIDALLGRELLSEDGAGRLRPTDAGRELQARIAVRQKANRDQIHAGITDEEYVAALKVLQRMIHNVGGSAWHH
ncbi:MarR family transcriptional regulator [Streptomyces sp. NPDC059009]|uniref:MarR family transcriptional regulator n=1 Tax=Streptomyces sp. NPDC059009 TaxID=3346694 RepID=UPI0036A1DE31